MEILICTECHQEITDSEKHMLWEHPTVDEIDECLRQLDVAGPYIVDLLAESRTMEAIMALYELEDLARRARGYLEKE
jgi:hypothetical protein